ncbi:hypothetical protein KAT67_06820 [candidate division WOR-3 bacterium]|nr:hypothetical protein [candidate division WOR-3 bacterium]
MGGQSQLDARWMAMKDDQEVKIGARAASFIVVFICAVVSTLLLPKK